jgi:beta-glucosidase
MAFIRFPNDFVWGAATSAHQIEGGRDSEGKGLSTWDVFAQQEGRILDQTTAAVACDHFHLYEQDVAMMKQMGYRGYRFSIAWPRVMPTGRGPVNEPGLDFYDRLVDALLAAGIRPFVTLYHWDLPQALQDEIGGWEHRDTCQLFADYADVVARRLGDRVRDWITHNEPGVAMEAYQLGEMPPGTINEKKARQVAHHVMLSHGLSAAAIRAVSPEKPRVGITVDLWPCQPETEDPADVEAAKMRWDLHWDWYLRPIAKGRYPGKAWESLGKNQPTVRQGDLAIINTDLDFFGLNYYSRLVVGKNGEIGPIPGSEYTDMAWEVYPDGLFQVLDKAQNEYDLGPIYITECGAAFPDVVSEDGRVHDERRLEFFKQHLAQVAKAIDAGIDVRGFLLWSLMDNWEWAHGFTKRFGIVHVDYETQKRTLKDSALWYQQVIKDGGFEL